MICKERDGQFWSLVADVRAGTPMRVIVDSSDGHYLTAYGSGLLEGSSGKELEFFVTGNASTILLYLLICSNPDIRSTDRKVPINLLTYLLLYRETYIRTG